MTKMLCAIRKIMDQIRIDDLEPCPCGSGIAFKDCCKNRQRTIIQSKKPVNVQVMENIRRSMKKCCLHPDKSKCTKHIKAAHALQNNKIISLLAGDEHHVYMISENKHPEFLTGNNGEKIPMALVSKVGVNEATTETCFCDYHDDIVFAVIEKNAPDYDPKNEEMAFVYAYKAFIFEYYKQLTSMNIFRKCFRDNHEAFTDRTGVALYRSMQLKMKEFDCIKNYFDNQILSGTLDGIYTCSIKLPEQIQFADYAFIAPEYDLNGGKIHHTQKGFMHRLSITIFPEQSCSWLLMSCLEEEKPIYDKFFLQFQNASYDKMKFYLNMILPLYSENMVLSPELWSKWDEQVKAAYTSYINLQGPMAAQMGMAIGFGLKNASKDKTERSYVTRPKLNLFA